MWARNVALNSLTIPKFGVHLNRKKSSRERELVSCDEYLLHVSILKLSWYQLNGVKTRHSDHQQPHLTVVAIVLAWPNNFFGFYQKY